MAKRERWVLDIQLNISGAQAEECIRGYLGYKKYAYKQAKDGEMYYELYDAMAGYRGFKYSIVGENVLHLETWIGKMGHEVNINDGKFTATVVKKAYMDEIQNLLSTLQNMESVSAAVENQTYGVPTTSTVDIIQSTANAQDKSNGKCAIAAFVVSLIFLLASCFGVIAGALLIVITVYLISRGLKSSKKGFSIAAIVIGSVSILVMIANLVLSVLLN